MDRNKDQKNQQPPLDDLEDGAFALVLDEAEVEVVEVSEKMPAARFDPKAKQQQPPKESAARDVTVRTAGNVSKTGAGPGGAGAGGSGGRSG